MPSNEVEMKVRLIDVEGIHGLIEALTNVAEESVKVVESYERGEYDQNLEDSIADLKFKILELNDYVDEHLHDE